MASTRPTEHLWTYGHLQDVPDDGLDYDIMEGALLMRNVPDTNHGVVLTDLFFFLGRAQEAGFGEVFTSSSAVALDYPA